MWKEPFRLNLLPEGAEPKMDYGPNLTPAEAMGKGGVVESSGPGTLTWWMGVPWQTDEASCLSGYEVGTYLSLPSFWAARVPNQVLSERSYRRVLDENLPDAYMGGQLTTNTIGSQNALGAVTDPPGYVQSSIATIRLWKRRP